MASYFNFPSAPAPDGKWYASWAERGQVVFELCKGEEASTLRINWIESSNHCGTELLREFEQLAYQLLHVRIIKLMCVLSELENTDTCLRRINFYIKNGYRVMDYCIVSKKRFSEVKLFMQKKLK